MTMLRVKIINNEFAPELPLNNIIDAIVVDNEGEQGYKLFHHSGWWWVPKHYCEEINHD